MTCIVGLIHKDKVYIGGDSLAGTYYLARKIAQPKVFRLGELLIGSTGSPRIIQIVQYGLSLEAQPETVDDMAYMVNTVAEGIRKALKEHGASTVDNNREETENSFLIGFHGRLYEVESNYQVLEYRLGFSAIGAGRDFALGALHTLANSTPPRQAVKSALRAAAHFSPWVCKPFTVLEL